MSWAQQAAAGRFCDAAEPAADEPGDGTLYDTAKFWGEEQRIKALEALGMLDTSREQFFDKVTALLMKVFDTQCSHLVLIDPNRCWFKSWQGRWCESETDSSHGKNVECPREEGWCNYILVANFEELLIIEDATTDARLALNPFVVGPPHFRFYAGAPLVGSRGERYGTLCVADFTPRRFASEQYSLLINYAALVVEELERHKPTKELLDESLGNYVERSRCLDKSLMAMKKGMCMLDLRDSRWPVMISNEAFDAVCGDVKGRNFWDIFKSNKRTALELGLATGLGDAFEMDVVSIEKGDDFHFELLPATSDRIAPSKCTAIPGWVPFEDENEEPNPKNSMKSREVVRDCKCFWFAIVSDRPMLTKKALQQADAAVEDPAKGGYNQELGVQRRPSVSSTGTGDDLSHLSSSLSGSWKSFFGDYALPPKLTGRVELGPLLRSGSFGKAYRGTMLGDEAMCVAVKVADCRRRQDQALRQQLKEVQLGAALHHGNVVRTLDYDTSGGAEASIDVLWIVQELCDLGNLVSATERGLLRVEPKITAPPCMPTVKSVLMDIARGMAYTHEMNIIHADLTGRNVLLQSSEETPGFTAKVADFGLARYSLEGKSLPSTDLGTVTHMPPEMMDTEGGRLTAAADVWAFGIVAWEAYHGKACYQGKNPAQVVMAIFRGKTPPWAPDAGAFGHLMQSCLAYEHSKRPSFKQILLDLPST